MGEQFDIGSTIVSWDELEGEVATSQNQGSFYWIISCEFNVGQCFLSVEKQRGWENSSRIRQGGDCWWIQIEGKEGLLFYIFSFASFVSQQLTFILPFPNNFQLQHTPLSNNNIHTVAIDHYTKCLAGLQKRGESQSDLAIKAHANRAACYKQISNFDGVIEDCTAVLEVDPENVKALVRRAQAFEGVERYRFALQDVKTVLAMPYAKVGKSNMDMCNMMQHRLNRTVQQLKGTQGDFFAVSC